MSSPINNPAYYWRHLPAWLLYNDFACTIFASTPVTASFIKKLASFWSVFELISLTRSLLLRCLIYIPGLVVDSKEVKPVKYLFLWAYQEHSLSYTSYCVKGFFLSKWERLKKIAWIQSLHLQWKFKLSVGKFTWGNKAKHCWVMSTNFLFSKMFCLSTTCKLSCP